MKTKVKLGNEEITQQLEAEGYDYAIAVATQSEIDNGAACGQLSIIAESEDSEN